MNKRSDFKIKRTCCLTFLAAFLNIFQATGQEIQELNEAQILAKEVDAIVAEGTRLYKCEQASWHATDIFSEQYPEKSDAVGGYISYPDSLGYKTIFFSSGINPVITATISFDSTLNPVTASIEKKERAFKPFEYSLYIIQLKALKDVSTRTEFYKAYKNTSFNLVPIIDSNSKRVYVMTGLKQSCLVIFGNDYMLTFDENNKVIDRRSFHKNIIPVECSKNVQEDGAKVPGTMHLHTAEGEDLITPTDICTIMLYQKLANWQQHTVFSKAHVSIWKCESNQLLVMNKEDWSNMFNRAANESTR